MIVWQFLDAADKMPTFDQTSPDDPAGPTVTGPGIYSLPGAIAGQKGIATYAQAFDAHCYCPGVKVAKLDATGVLVGVTTVVSSAQVLNTADMTAEIHQFGIDRCRAIIAATPGIAQVLIDAVNAKEDYLNSAINAAQLETVLVAARALPYVQYRNAICDACRADVGGPKWATHWITRYLGDVAAIETSFGIIASAKTGGL